MAVIRMGGGVAAASGSVGGTVFSRNRSGPYMRNRSMPINPGSEFQQNVRFAVALLASRWVETLTPAQRAAWEAYALNVPLTGPLGDPRNVGGIGMYIRSNAPRVAFPYLTPTVIDDAPTIFDLGTFTQPVIGVADAAADTVSVGYTNTDEWANESGSGMYFYLSRPNNPSINYFKGPYRWCGYVAGDDAVPPVGPIALDAPFPFEVGHKLFLRVNVTRVDGRLASSFRGSVVGV